MAETSALHLKRQLKELAKSPHEYFSAGLVDESNLYEWEILVIPPSGTLYEGGFFKAVMTFPKEYPELPPTLTFKSNIYHPNVYPDGRVCISILHPPGEDTYGYEQASERWLPIYTVETIMISVISMLSEPNDQSPANVDAAKEFRESPEGFKKKVARCVRRSVDDM
ncbi:ubiquitin-conjugating protein 13-like protein [Blastocladiella britannica]|nr:ubiquitin-conjugating protein 13-like protein [Blastocladiella britannica]